jgi:hypothetical protein
MTTSNENTPDATASHAPRPHFMVTLEHRARRVVLAAAVSLVGVLAVQFYDTEHLATAAYRAARDTWLASENGSARLDYLMQDCNSGTPFTYGQAYHGNAPLTDRECDMWVATEARRRWSMDVIARMLELRKAQDSAVKAVFDARPAPLRYFF